MNTKQIDSEIETSEALTTTTSDTGIAVTNDGDMMIGGFAFTPTSLVPADPNTPPDYEAWEQVGVFLRYVHTGSQFWIGDWLNYGENHYGEKYAQAVEATGYELHTLQNYAWVARQVPRSNRLEKVPFGHYANALAALPPADQAEWAKKAADENMSQLALRNALAERRAANGNAPVDLWLIVKCKDQKDFDKLEKQLTREGREVTSRVKAAKVIKVKPPKPAKPVKAAKKTAAPKADTPKAVKIKKTTTAPGDFSSVANVVPTSDGEAKLDAFWIPPTPDETPTQKKKRLKKINNARFRAKAKARA